MKEKVVIGLLVIALLILLPQVSIAEVWSMQGHDAQRTSRSSVPGPLTSTLKWTYDFTGTRLQDNASPVVGPDGTIYVPTETNFYAIKTDGTLKWEKTYAMGKSYVMKNAPALSPDGSLIYILSSWLDSDTSVNAVDSQTGAIQWTYLLGEKISYSSFAVGGDGTIYIGTWKHAMYAINQNGTLKWRYDSSSTCGIEAPPAVDSNGNVYFVHNCLSLLALDSNGSLKWTSSYPSGDYGWPTPAIGTNGTIYSSGGSYTATTFYAINPDGSLKWNRTDVGQAGWYKGVAISSDGSTIYTSGDGKVYALNSLTGATEWVSTIADSNEDFGGSPALSSNKILYLMGNKGAGNDYVYAVSAKDGSLIWQYQLNSMATYWGPQSPALGPDGTLYVASSGTVNSAARLYAFEYSASDLLLSIAKSGTGTGTVTTSPSGINCGSTCTAAFISGTQITLTANTGTGSTFTGWSGDCSGSDNEITISVNASKSCTATFTLNTYTITAAGAGVNGGTIIQNSGSPVINATWNGTVTGGDNTETVNYDSGPYTITATANTGRNATWSGDCNSMIGNGTGTATCSISAGISANKNIVATFAINNYTITPSIGSGTDHGSISPNTAQILTHGSTTTFTVTPDNGYTASVGGTCGGVLSGTTYTTNAATGNCTVIANFALNSYSVNPSIGSGTGHGSISPNTPQTVVDGAATTFEVTPETGYTASVGGTCGGTLSVTTYTTNTISGNCTVIVTFTLTLHVIAKDTYNFYKTFKSNNLPYNWFNIQNESKGAYANPAEIGFYMLSHIIAYEMQQDWSPSLPDVVSELQTTIDRLEAWQSETQVSKPNGPNSYEGKAFFQWYWIEWNPPVVGANSDTNQVVPSIDNAWLAASLIVIKEFANSKGETALATKADNILKDMDFSIWYDSSIKRFFWGDSNNPRSGGEENYYSNENRIVNFVARSLDIGYNRNQFSREEFLDSLDSLVKKSGTYNGITIDRVNWDGSYFTYLTPALFIREMDTAYGVNTINKATEAQIAYAADKGYAAWGISDCSDVENRGYVTRGAPPRGSGDENTDKDDGLITPHASALGLITGHAEDAKANLLKLKNDYPSVYDDRYGLKDSINLDSSGPDYLKTSNTILGLDQAWILMAIGNYLNSTLHNYFNQNAGVSNAYNEMNNFSLIKTTKTGAGSGTVTSASAGINCGSTCTASFSNGTQITLTANAGTGSSFKSWSGDCSGINSQITITVNASKSCAASFTLNSYTLTVAGAGIDGGTIVENNGNPIINAAWTGTITGGDNTETVNYGAGPYTITAIANTGRNVSWSGDCDTSSGNGTGAATCTINAGISANKNITAVFTLNQYALTVNKAGNGSGTVSGGDLYDYGTSHDITATPDTGSTFGGWSGDCTGATSPLSVLVDKAKTCTATFTLNTYALTVNKAGTGSGTVGGGGTYDYGTSHDITAVAATGSTFTGWSVDCTGTTSPFGVLIDKAKTCIATFTANPVNGTCGSSSGQKFTTTPITNLCSTGTPTSVSGSGPWTWNCAGANGGMTSNCSASLKTWTVTPSAGAGGSISPNTAQPVKHGSVTLFTVTPNSGYATSVGGTCGGTLSGNTYTTNAITTDCTVTATFAAILIPTQYTLTVNKSGTGSGGVTATGINCGPDCSKSYDAGTSVTLTATADSSATFNGWSGACTGTETSCTVTMDAAKSVTAVFTQAAPDGKFNLTIITDGSGSGNVTANKGTLDCSDNVCTAAYDDGTSLGLTAIAESGSLFAGWDGCDSTNANKCTVAMNESKTIIATFNSFPKLNVTVNSSESEYGTGTGKVFVAGINCSNAEDTTAVDCEQTYSKTTRVILKAVPDYGSRLAGWDGCDISSITAKTCSVTISTEDIEIIVTFEPIPQYALTVTKSGNGTGTVTSSPRGIVRAISCNGLCSDDFANYVENKPVTLIARTDKGSKFVGWSGGGCTGIKPTCKIAKMDGSKDVIAAFGKPAISLSTDSIDFGSVTKKTTSTQTFVINNNGDADLKVTRIKASGKGAAMYKLYNSDTGRALSSAKITAGGSITVEVRFKPTTSGDKPATLTISSDDIDTPKTTVSLSGAGK